MHRTSPKYRVQSKGAPVPMKHHRAGRKERAEQARHRQLSIPRPTADIGYRCRVPGCTNDSLVPHRERDSWVVPIGHWGPMPNKHYNPQNPDSKPVLWIPFVTKVAGCPECWIRLQKAPDGFLPDGKGK